MTDQVIREIRIVHWAELPAAELTKKRGSHADVTESVTEILNAVKMEGDKALFRFTQQYDPFTGRASLVHAVSHQPVSDAGSEPVQDAYGPTMLACLEYIAHGYGIHPHLGTVWFSLGCGKPYQYEAVFYQHRYRIDSSGKTAEITVDGRSIGRWECGCRVVTGERGGRFPAFVLWLEIRTFEVTKLH